MALRNIVTEGDPILRKKCREVAEVDDRIRTIMEDMLETMHEYNGVGIAAPQVGIMRRMFIAEPEPGETYYMINPKIIDQKGSQTGEEGCLSVPGYVGTVTRPAYVKIEALNLEGERYVLDAKDFLATIISHEYDHLEGTLFVDKAKDIHEAYESEDEYED